MNRLYLLSIVIFVACKSSPDFQHLSKGMNGTEVLKHAGVPSKKIPMGNYTWWVYEGQQARVVILNNDTVSSVLTQEEAATMMRRALDSANAIKRSQAK